MNENDFVYELQEILDKEIFPFLINDNTNKMEFYKAIEKFKIKYDNLNFTNLNKDRRREFAKNVIILFANAYEKFKSNNSLNSFYDFILDFIDFLPKLYNLEEFGFDNCCPDLIDKTINSSNSRNKIFNLSTLFLKIGNKNTSSFSTLSNYGSNITLEEFFNKAKLAFNIEGECIVNKFVDLLFVSLINESDPKIVFISNNLLTKFKNFSSFLSFKLLVLNLIILLRIKNKHKFFSTALSNIANFLLPESILFGRKLNIVLFDNKFNDFEFDPKGESRKLNNAEFEFLRYNLFPFLNLIVDHLQMQDTLNGDLTSRENKLSLIKLIENSIEAGKTKIDDYDSRQIFIYQNYLIMCFITDCFEFIFSNLHYLDSKFSTEDGLNINTDPFELFQEKIRPIKYQNFIENIFLFIQNKLCSNIVTLIETYLKSCEIKNLKLESINEMEKYEDGTYFIYEPFNSVGFPLMCWLIWKENKFNFLPTVYSSVYILDLFLPISSALIKRGQNFRMMGIDLLFDILSIISENTVVSLSSFNFYSYEDVFKDLLEFIGGVDIEIKRIHVTKNLSKVIKILSHEAKKDLFLFVLKDILKEDTKNINDARASFVIYTLKNLLSEYLKVNPLDTHISMFDSKFLKEIIKLSLNKNLFVIDILETISQGLNFLHFTLIQDQTVFKGRLNIYDRDYLHEIEKDIDIVAKFIQKWVNSNDEEKMKNVHIDTSELNFITDFSEKKEELKRSFELRKNQAMITLNMIDNVDKLIRKNLNKLSTNESK
jgi:hypothetical protein